MRLVGKNSATEIIYANKGQHKMWVGGRLVHDEMNPYCWETAASTDEYLDFEGYIPYIIRDSGWGETTAKNDPADRYVGILRYIHPGRQHPYRIRRW